jgi:tRNA1Val (adenine37-N6)-methyltransferase
MNCSADKPRFEVPLLPGERIDDLQRDGLFIIQHTGRFRFGIDAVCLSDFITVKKGERVIDLGTGSGIIPILLSAKTKGRHFTGLEIQQESVEMARRSVQMNGLNDRISIDEGDIKRAAEVYGSAVFDVVCSNPPYMNTGGGLLNENSSKAIARHEISCSLEDVVQVSARLLVPGGRLYIVHRPHRLADVICTLRAAKLEPKTVQFVQPDTNHPPVLVMVEAIDHGKPMVKVMETLMLE